MSGLRPAPAPLGDPRVIAADDPAALATVTRALRDGLLVALPTETVYGVACALTAAALDRLLAAKGRPSSKGITLLVDDLASAAHLVASSRDAEALAARFWPGPLTLVLPLRAGERLPDAVTGGTSTVGLRVPDDQLARALARAMGPLPLTSANRSGEAAARDAHEVVAALGRAVAVVVDGGPSPGGVPSTVVALGQGPFQVLRAGPIAADDVARALEG
ncbi:MAG: L-threonylcarbamoyladenylate synthase [Candidatus Limnocylindrales bacterium]